MAKIYVSSTLRDLEPERRAVMEWLRRSGYLAVDSYLPASDSVRASCLEDIDACELYVLILGHRYGFQPVDDNPDNLSITQLEFRRAGQRRIPRIALLRTSIPDINTSDLEDPQRSRCVAAFRAEVEAAVRPGLFSDLHELIQCLSTGVQKEISRLELQHAETSPPGHSGTLAAKQIRQQPGHGEPARGRERPHHRGAVVPQALGAKVAVVLVLLSALVAGVLLMRPERSAQTRAPSADSNQTAQPESAREPGEAQASTHSLVVAGTVVDAASNRGIAQALIEVEGAEATFLSEDTGNFRSHVPSALANDRVRMHVRKPGYRPIDRSVLPPTENLIVPMTRE
jgi:hypothetical protein